jgi:hypothetical protein
MEEVEKIILNMLIASKTLFIIPTDAHYYKSVEMLKQFKSYNTCPTCFGSRRNHHQGAVLCLAKTADMVFFCARRYRRSARLHNRPICRHSID